MKNRAFYLVLLLVCSVAGFGQIKSRNLEVAKVPPGIKYKGEIKSAVIWADKLGENIVITTETGITKGKAVNDDSDDNREAELFAYHYIVSGGSVKQTWKVYDFIKECPFDVQTQFIRNTFQVTDLNNDGVAEVWLMYKISCRSDVSPSDMKIIMYQGLQKYAMRGQNKVSGGNDENGKAIYYGGEYKFDLAFDQGPKEFLDFAKSLWNKNLMETW